MADELRCSECSKPVAADACGLVHAIMRIQMAAIHKVTHNLLRGGRRG